MCREYKLSMTVYRTGNAIAHFLANELSDTGVPYTQAIILCKLAEMPLHTATQKQLKEYLQVSSASMSNLIKRMIGNGLLQQKTDKKDNRVNVISLTPKSISLLPEISDRLDRAEEQIYAGFSQKDKACFHSLLGRIQNNLVCFEKTVDKVNDKEFSL